MRVRRDRHAIAQAALRQRGREVGDALVAVHRILRRAADRRRGLVPGRWRLIDAGVGTLLAAVYIRRHHPPRGVAREFDLGCSCAHPSPPSDFAFGASGGAAARSESKVRGRRGMSTTTSKVELARNAPGRMVPAYVNGREQRPYSGINEPPPAGHKAAPPVRSSAQYPMDGDKRVPDLATALTQCGLRDGMTISSHPHLRDGDQVALPALQTAASLGAKDLMWFPSASFPAHAPVIDLMEAGAVHHIEGSMNGPLGDYCSRGKMRGMGVLRSHGGRWQAIQDGEVHIDIATVSYTHLRAHETRHD